MRPQGSTMPRHSSASATLAAVLCLLLAAGCSKSPEQWLARGLENARKGSHEKAVAAFDRALQKPGAHTRSAQYEKALSLYSLGQWDESARSALASAQGQPADAAKGARVLALRCMAESGDKSEGARVLAMLGPDALKDPLVAEAARKLGLNDGNSPAASDVPSKPNGRKVELAKLNAIQVDIANVVTATSADPAQFPLRVDFQDPRSTVKVPSPDGKWLVWRGLEAGKGYYLFLSDASGAKAQRLDACKNGFQPVWSPDGKKILYSAMDWRTEERNLFIYDIAAKSARRAFIAKKKVGPLATWTPDGSKIVFTYFDELWITNANGIGRGMLNLGGRMKMNVDDARLFAWSADGSRLAYGPKGQDTVYQIDLTSKF